MADYRQNFIDSSAVYLPGVLPVWSNLLNTEATALSSKIKQHTITGGGNIEAVAEVGFNGGFGSLPDDLTAPKAGRNIYQKFIETRRRMAVSINISDESIRASSNDKRAMINLLDAEIKSAYATAKWNVGRMLFGDGKGVLTKIASIAGNTATLPSDETAHPENVKEGLTIDIYEGSAEVGTEPKASKRRILSVNRLASPVTFTFDGDTVTMSEGFITIQMSYGNEITGLGAIFDDEIDTLYGVKKADMPLIKPIVEDAAGDINDSIINRTLRSAKNDKGSNIDMLLMGDDAFDHYVEYLRVNNIRNERPDLTITGGFAAIDYLFSNKHVAIVNEEFVPKDEAWGFDTSKLGFYQLADWDFASEGGSAFTLVPGTLVYNAAIVKYGNLICTNPGGCVRITGCAE